MPTYMRMGAIYLFYLSMVVELCFRYELSAIPGVNLKNIAILIFILTIFVFNILEKKPLIGVNKLNLPIILFLWVCFLSIFTTYTFKIFPNYKLIVEVLYFRPYVEIYILPLLVYNLLHDTKSIRALLLSLFVLSFIINVVTLLGAHDIIQVGKVNLEKGTRLSGAFGGPNQYSAFVALFIPFGIAFLLHTKSYAAKIFVVITLLTSFYSLLLAGSRGGLISAFIGVNAIIILINKEISLQFILKLISVWAVIAIIASVSLYILPDASKNVLHKNIIGRALDEDVKDEYQSDYSSGRIYLWKAALKIFFEHPVLGSGWQTYRRIVRKTTHNDYLAILAEIGIVGLAAFLFLFYRLLSVPHEYRKHADSSVFYYNAYLAGLCSLMTSMFFQNMFTTLIFFFIFTGLIFKMGDLESTIRSGDSNPAEV